MNQNEILQKINEIFVDVLDDPRISVNEFTTAGDVEGWDSLTHIQLVVAIERAFKIRFSSKEIQNWANVGEMVSCICARTP
jgi:acyl carrier protein